MHNRKIVLLFSLAASLVSAQTPAVKPAQKVPSFMGGLLQSGL